MILRAIFVPDARVLFTGAQCELSSGEVVEVWYTAQIVEKFSVGRSRFWSHA